MKISADTQLCTFEEFSGWRPHPDNLEHCEAFMKERYLIAIQLVLIYGGGLSNLARDTFPIIDNKDFSLERLRFWSLDFQSWRETLKPRDRRTFDSIRFLPAKV